MDYISQINIINQSINEIKLDEIKLDEGKFDDSKNNNCIKNEIKKKKFILGNKQKLIMNNFKETKLLNTQLILNGIYSTDDEIYTQIYSLINNPYQKRLNTINLLLNSDLQIPMNNLLDIKKFFNWLSPLNNEFNLSSKDWTFKTIKYGNREKILLHNSISKKDMGMTFYSNYIDLVKKKLSQSNVDYMYFEFKSKRFNKVKDIVWAFTPS